MRINSILTNYFSPLISTYPQHVYFSVYFNPQQSNKLSTVLVLHGSRKDSRQSCDEPNANMCVINSCEFYPSLHFHYFAATFV
jgi:hypothetical protein